MNSPIFNPFSQIEIENDASPAAGWGIYVGFGIHVERKRQYGCRTLRSVRRRYGQSGPDDTTRHCLFL